MLKMSAYVLGIPLKSSNIILSRTNTLNFLRRKKSCLGYWNENISTEIKLLIEKHWSTEVLSKDLERKDKQFYYVLPMFPYPSGNLHMGHVRVYSISDTIARFHKLSGNNVIHPIGWDAFGLPAENAAIERDIPPYIWTETNINTMKNQLLELGYNFDWDKEVNTSDPKYYKWTQYIFLQLFENNLAYQNKAYVNWDPIDKTVLADEQVDDNGCSWRSGAKVEKKILTQWFIKTTKYAKSLFEGLDSKLLENWNDIINLQKHWIGECNGIVVTFKMVIGNTEKCFDIWTSDPFKLIHGEFVIISTNHVLLYELDSMNMENLICFNPVTNKNLPVIVTNAIEYPEGRDAHIGCASLDVSDMNLAVSLNIPITKKKFDVNLENDNKKAIDIALSKQCGGYFVSSKLKDWLISRQRYWGTPIPIIHCPQCGPVAVPYKDLPVILPQISKSETGSYSLSKLNEWINCKCPKCSADAKRETDTMDTFVDSSWYFYRYLDSCNEQAPFNKGSLIEKMPVNCYIGGKEHAVLHLYYARFMSYFLHSLGWTVSDEPFKRLLVQGMVMGQSYKVKVSGKYIPPEKVEKVGNRYKEKETGEDVSVQWEKMSKSKYNGVNPQKLLSSYGCDATRLLILADVPPATSRHWSDATLPGVLNWQHRLWITMREFLIHRNNFEESSKILSDDEIKEFENKIWNSRNYLIATTTYHFRHTQKLSVGISRLQSLTSILRNKVPPEIVAKCKQFELALAQLIIMISPVTPHFCSELWAGFLSAPNRININSNYIDWNKSVLQQKWPVVDPNYELSFQCKVDGADRCDLKIKAADLNNIKEEEALQIMLGQENVAKRIKNDILTTKYELYPDCRSILHIYTRRKEMKPVLDKEKSSQLLQA